MKYAFILIALTIGSNIGGQDMGFPCDGAMYLVNYTQSTGVSTLFQVTERDKSLTYSSITLSEDRRLTALAYNVLDKHLYALDVDTYELVKINRVGTVTSLTVPASIDQDYIFNAGTISPDGSGILLIGFSEEFGFDNRFYTINLSRDNFYAGYLGVTGDSRAEIHDFATDPLSGEIYGYNNLEGRLAQIGIGGQISSLRFPTTGVTSMDGLFFNQKGELFGYSAQRGFFYINKLTGEVNFLSSGPEGTSGDACSCPYTSTFEKEITPRQILPCQEFEITYTFENRLGIGQTWIKVRDTLPEGFEILDVEGGIITSVNRIPSAPNVLALDNLIYLMGHNEVKVKVRAPSDYLGPFSSSAVHWDFPLAFETYQYTDDPTTDEARDATEASIVTQDDIDFSESITYGCDGSEAIISSPISAPQYQWSNGSTEPFITVNEPGWYTLMTENDCIVYFDSVQVLDFPSEKRVTIDGQMNITLGESVDLVATLDRGVPMLYEWINTEDTIRCGDCPSHTVMPGEDTQYMVNITDEDGCETSADIDISVEQIRYFYAATAFSPNDDGINDLFFLQSSTEGVVKEMKVYNRWGNEIFLKKNVALNNESAGWDGKYKEDPLSSGIYIWIAEVQYFDGVTEMKTGAITLVAAQ